MDPNQNNNSTDTSQPQVPESSSVPQTSEGQTFNESPLPPTTNFQNSDPTIPQPTTGHEQNPYPNTPFQESSTPSVVTTTTSNNTNFRDNSPLINPSNTKPRRKKLLVITSVITTLALLTGSLVFGALVAFGKIDLGNNDLENKIASFIFSLPFITPTPEFILGATSRAHESITSFYFDSSFAIEIEGQETSTPNPFDIPNLLSPELPFDFSSFEIKTEGFLDYNDTDNPKSKIGFNVENQVSADFISVDEIFYFKVNKVPTILTTLMSGYGFDINPFLNSWVSYPIEKLDTEAKDIIQQRKDQEVDTSEYDKFMEVMKTEVVPKLLVTNGSDTIDNTHKLYLTLTDSQIKDIARKLSDDNSLDAYVGARNQETVISSFELTLWIDKSSFLVRRMEIYTSVSEADIIDPATTNVLGSTFGLAKSDDMTIHMAVTTNLSRYGELFELSAPEQVETIEEFAKRIGESVNPIIGSTINPTLQIAKARDASRKSTVMQLGRATMAFYTTKQTYPSETNFWVQELVSAGDISSIPASVEYQTSVPCSNAVANSTWCYNLDTANSNALIYARLESNDDCPTELPAAWYAYSTARGRGGTICTAEFEPTTDAQEFID